MAGIGFSPFVLDSFMVPTNISNNLSTSIQEETTSFSHIYPCDYFLQDIPLHPHFHEKTTTPPLLDTIISTSTTTSIQEETTCFSHIYPCDYFLQDIPLHPHFHEKTTTPPLLDTIISTSTATSHSHPNSSSSSSSMRLETSAETQAISKVVTGSMVKSREKKKTKIIDNSKVEKEGNKKGRKQKSKSDAMLKVITEEKKLKAAAEDHHHHKKAKKEKDDITHTTTNGYVQVRARRGEATDSHSLAERVRREKISERMRLLQSLVPGCDKIKGKAQVLDEIINYVQSMQNQVEFLLAKLASVGVGPMLNEFEFDFDANPLVSEIVDILAAAATITNYETQSSNHIQVSRMNNE